MLIITGVSASGKTVLQEDMLQRGFNKPINFTTREPRYEDEVDDYVFLDEDRFIYLLRKDIFIDHTN
jgi:guanylate kinase